MNKCFYRHRNQNRISINTYLPRIINPHPASLTPLPPLTSLTPAPPPPLGHVVEPAAYAGLALLVLMMGFRGVIFFALIYVVSQVSAGRSIASLFTRGGGGGGGATTRGATSTTTSGARPPRVTPPTDRGQQGQKRGGGGHRLGDN